MILEGIREVVNYREITTLKLLASDGKIFTVSRDLLHQSVNINAMLEEAEYYDGELIEPFPIPKTPAPVLSKILTFCQFHQYNPVLRCDKENEDSNLSSWDAEFLKSDDGISVTDLLIGANEMKLYRLMDVGCKYIANALKGKSTEQMRKMMNIENDFTPEEEEKVRLESALMMCSIKRK